jgi:hypothetical protein
MKYPRAKPGLPDVMEQFGYNLSRNLNCMLIGKILKYDDETNTCEVEVMLKRLLEDGTKLSFPPLVDCPVIYLGGGGAFLSFPIAKGDPCCVFFSDRSIDEWWQAGRAEVPSENRAHSLSDGVVLVGPRPQTGLLTLDDAVTLNAGLHKIRIRNQVQTLKTLLNTMVDAIIGATGTVAGSACTITANPNAIATKALIAQLFEE